MVSFSELLSRDMADKMNMIPGTVLLGEMEGVDHLKFFVIVGVGLDMVCVCAVVINSSINPFIMKRPHLLARQVQLQCKRYDFLSHDSYVNCANPLKGKAENFKGYRRVGQLTDEDLVLVREEIVSSGMLSANELKSYQLLAEASR